RTAAVHEEERHARPAAVDAAHEAVVARGTGRAAQHHLAEELGVIGHRGEVERTLELRAAPGPAGGVPRVEADRLAAREAVGLLRSRARALRAGVERPARVHVQVAEQRLA